MRSPIKIDYQFQKAYYGPCSYKLYSIVENLVTMGLLCEKKMKTASGNVVVQYKLTPSGKSLVSKKLGIMPERVREKIREIYKEYGTLPLISLIRRVYDEYPGWVEKSVFLAF